MLKRTFDLLLSCMGLVVLSPVLLLACLAIWLQDFRSPFYLASRVGRGKCEFRMIKLRSMVVNADQIGGASTAGGDRRVTVVGRFVRRYKMDEAMQLLNVVKGDMSLVGPRPQILQGGVDRYTPEETRILSVRPGVTDLASIVFADEGEILAGSNDPDALYDEIIRPWKSRLALCYVDNHSVALDLELVLTTILTIFARPLAIQRVQSILERLNADPRLTRVASRKERLYPFPPPGEVGARAPATDLDTSHAKQTPHRGDQPSACE